MNKDQQIQAKTNLRMAHDQIVSLRREIAELAPKAHAYDTIAAMTRQTRQIDGGYAEADAAWRIKSFLESLEAPQKSKAEVDSPAE